MKIKYILWSVPLAYCIYAFLKNMEKSPLNKYYENVNNGSVSAFHNENDIEYQEFAKTLSNDYVDAK